MDNFIYNNNMILNAFTRPSLYGADLPLGPSSVLKVLAVLTSGAIGVGGTTREVTDEEYALFPRLFHLDDHSSCMLNDDALYCLGTFDIVDSSNKPALRLMKEYSEDLHNFNRTRLHRGYCVSERCPSPPPHTHSRSQCSSNHHLNIRSSNCSHSHAEKVHLVYDNSNKTCGSNKNLQQSKSNNTLRFLRCVSKYAKKQNLDVQLSSLQYCHTKQDVSKEWKIETPHRVFLWVVGIVVVMNVVGTVYDGMTNDKKSRLLTAWSIRSNWQHLAGPFADGDPRLSTLLPTEGARVLILLLVIFVHSGCIQDQLYLGNPRLVERMSHIPLMKLLHNGQSAIQMFILLSSYLLAQAVLQAEQPSFWLLPKLLVKRILRIAPVYLLVLGFAASWWAQAGGGPQWAPLVEAESRACRNQFWALAVFGGNFVRDRDTCLLQTWYLQVEMQLYVFALLLTLALTRVRRWALAVLGGLFLASCVGTMALAYDHGWTPLMVVAGPENVRTSFSNVELFREFLTKPWANVGASLAGLFVAHLHHALQRRGFDPKNHKWLITGCQLVLPILPCWTGLVGHLFRDLQSREAHAVFLALERPVMALLFAVLMFGAYNGRSSTKIDKSSKSESVPSSRGYIKHLFTWKMFYPLGRMSLAVLMMHWVVNKTFAASRPGLYYTSVLDLVADFMLTTSLTYLLAVPVTLLIDIPMQQFFRAVIL